MIDVNRDEIFQNSRVTPSFFDLKRDEEILEELKV